MNHQIRYTVLMFALIVLPACSSQQHPARSPGNVQGAACYSRVCGPPELRKQWQLSGEAAAQKPGASARDNCLSGRCGRGVQSHTFNLENDSRECLARVCGPPMK